MTKRLIAGAALALAVLALSGCEEGYTLEERLANRAECEAIEGRYWETPARANDTVLDWGCDLERSDG